MFLANDYQKLETTEMKKFEMLLDLMPSWLSDRGVGAG
jgi:hypothetical protein